MTVMGPGSTGASLKEVEARLAPENARESSSPDAQTTCRREGPRGPRPRAQSVEDATADASALKVRERLARLQTLDNAALREEWRRLCGSAPPRVSRDLLTRALAYRFQVLALGGLPRWAARYLSGPAESSDGREAAPAPTEPRLKPGARLLREWHGRTHSVIVLDDGFEFEGRRYRSLTQVAHEITGARWSGPRFFGLRDRRARPRESQGQKPTRTPGADPTLGGADGVWRESITSVRANLHGDGVGGRR